MNLKMKKSLMSVVSFFFIVLVSAQNPLSKGQTQLNAGFGFSDHGIPVYVGFDYGVHKDVTIGGEMSFRSYHENYNNGTYDHSVFCLLFNSNYHFNTIMKIPTNWDLYAGLNIGFAFYNSPDNYPGDAHSEFGLGAQVGGRYFFTNNFGLNLEFGGGNAFSGGKFGITYKF